MIPLLAALCVGVLLGYVLCGLVHRAAWDAERRTEERDLEERTDFLLETWWRFNEVRRVEAGRPRITHVAEMDEHIRQRRDGD